MGVCEFKVFVRCGQVFVVVFIQKSVEQNIGKIIW